MVNLSLSLWGDPHGYFFSIYYLDNMQILVLLCSNMEIADFLSFIHHLDHYPIRSNFQFDSILFLKGQRRFLPILAKIGLEAKMLRRFYSTLTWNSPIFDNFSIQSNFQFGPRLFLNGQDHSYQIWRRLGQKQRSYGDFSLL